MSKLHDRNVYLVNSNDDVEQLNIANILRMKIILIVLIMTMMKWNKFMKMMNGNKSRRGKGIKILVWNNGKSLLHNAMEEIEALIEEQRPEIFSLSESNLIRDTDMNTVSIDDYTIHTAPTLTNDNLNISRMVVYTSKDLIVKRRHDLEDKTLINLVGSELSKNEESIGWESLSGMAVHVTNRQ